MPLIVVEGPDGGGKSTLVRSLCEVLEVEPLPRACTSEGGPVDDLAGWTTDFLNNHQIDKVRAEARLSSVDEAMKPEFIDRFPLLSEPVYGPAVRGSMAPQFDTEWYGAALLSFALLRPMVIYCLPPLTTVMENLSAEKQMSGVKSNIMAIYSLYQAQAGWLDAVGIHNIRYDYTERNGRLDVTRLADLFRQIKEEAAQGG